MSNVNTGQLLNFQDYSPEHNDRTARIDVEAVHTNQYNSAMTNPNYDFGAGEPKIEEEEPGKPQTPAKSVFCIQRPKRSFTSKNLQKTCTGYNYIIFAGTVFGVIGVIGNHNFWTIEYYQKYFDVQTSEVVERIISSVLPQKVSPNYFDERIRGKPDLYGPIWISVTLIFTIAVSGNIASYLQNANKMVHWRYDFHLVSYAATAIICYVWIVPLALWGALKWSIPTAGQDEIENQQSPTPTMMSLFCLYGYSLAIYIPVAVLWTIQVSWLQWLFVMVAASVSGAVLIFWLMPVLRKSRYFPILIGCILGVHLLLATGFMLYFFHTPSSSAVIPPPLIVSTTQAAA